MKPFSVAITREELAVVSLFAAVNDVRYYLNGVYFECGPLGGRLVATNGHHLMVARIDADRCTGEGSAIIDAESVAAALRMFKTHPAGLAMPFGFADNAGNVPHVTVGLENGQQFTARTVDGKFPDYQRVMPIKTDGVAAQFEPAYIATFAKAAKARGSRSAMVNISHNGNSAALVCIGDASKYCGVLMAKMGVPMAESPEWTRDPLVPAPVKVKRNANAGAEPEQAAA
jgi:DNA polymerase-3 subunit beta